MKMKSIHHFVLAITALLICSAYSTMANATEHQQAARMLALAEFGAQSPDELYRVGAENVANSVEITFRVRLGRELNPVEKEKLIAEVSKLMKELVSDDELIDKHARMIEERFSLSELRQINEFHSTEVGRKLLRSRPEMAREARVAGALLVERVKGEEAQRRLQEILQSVFPDLFPTEKRRKK